MSTADNADCCESKENGFKCTCVKTGWAYSQRAEDDGRGDYERDQQKDRELDAHAETSAMLDHNEYRGADYGED